MTTAQVQTTEQQNRPAQAPAWIPPHYVRSLSLTIPAIFLGLQISGWIFAMFALAQGRVDFRAMYTGGYMVRTGNGSQLYDYNAQLLLQNRLVTARNVTMPFDHLPYEALLFVPFSYLPFKSAYFAMLAVNFAALVLSIILLRRWTTHLDAIYFWLRPVLIAVFLPTAVALMQGQDSILLLLCLTATFLMLESGREFSAGIVLSLGLFKFQIIVPIAILFLLWKRWRFFFGFLATSIALLGISFTLIGKTAAITYIRLLLSMSTGLTSAAEAARLAIPPSGMANLRGLIFCPLNGHIPSRWIQILIFVLSAICLIVSWIGGRKSRNGRSLLIAIAASALVSYHFNLHDLTILLLPTLIALDQCIHAVPNGPPRERHMAATAAALYTAPIFFCFEPEYFYLVAIVILAFWFSELRWTSSETLRYEPGRSL